VLFRSFLAAYAELGRRDPHFAPERCPVLSCNLSECELPALGGNGIGHLAAGPYFRDVAKPDPAAPASSFQASAYASVRVLADVLALDPDAGFADLPRLFAGRTFDTPFGRTALDPRTQHATLPVEIGRIEAAGFRVVSRTEAVAPDPYLSRYDRNTTFRRPGLRVVS